MITLLVVENSNSAINGLQKWKQLNLAVIISQKVAVTVWTLFLCQIDAVVVDANTESLFWSNIWNFKDNETDDGGFDCDY